MISINKKKLVVNIATVIFIIIFSFFFREFIANYFVRIKLENIQTPKKEDRVLVFAPHNDDETLATGEFIKKSIENGTRVKVVFMTNGDGFKQALELDNFNLHPKKEDYINFGYTRQKESINALNYLGLKEENIIFLGYPDGGLNHLWATNWDKKTLT